jgi:predicted dehydrogenase
MFSMAARRLRVVIAGIGANVFAMHRPGIESIGAEVVAVHDVDGARAARRAEGLGCPVAASARELMETDAELAVILAPHPHHEELAVAALRAGKHVLTEKPIAVTVAEADRMVLEAERRERVLAVAFQHRTRHEVREARRLVDAGFLGQLQRADVIGTWPRPRAYFQAASWRGTWVGEGGGVLINQGQHDLDLLVHLAGSPARVMGWTRRRLHSIETEDSAQAMVEWADGALGAIHVSTAEVDLPQRIELTGTAGRMRLTHGRLEAVANGVDFREFAASAQDPFAAMPQLAVREVDGGGGTHADVYRDLAEAIRSGTPPIAPGRDAMRALELANAIIYSSLTGAVVELPLDREAYTARVDPLRAARARS